MNLQMAYILLLTLKNRKDFQINSDFLTTYKFDNEV